jgi:ribosomal protein L37AE/L43A
MSPTPTTSEATETGGGQPATEAWGDAETDEATRFFRETIGDWRCRNCATEFAVGSLFDLHPRLGNTVSCPVCGCDDVARRDGGGR